MPSLIEPEHHARRTRLSGQLFRVVQLWLRSYSRSATAYNFCIQGQIRLTRHLVISSQGLIAAREQALADARAHAQTQHYSDGGAIEARQKKRAAILRSRAARSLATKFAFSNWLTARGLGRHQLDAERAQIVVPRDLHTEVARKPVGALDQNDAPAIAGNPVEHGLEARSLGHRIGAAHRRVL